MTKALKSMVKNRLDQLIENQLRGADRLAKIRLARICLGRVDRGTPFAIRAAIPAAFDQGGAASRAHSIPLSVTPFSLLGQYEASQ
jgi:hypothetical protein